MNEVLRDVGTTFRIVHRLHNGAELKEGETVTVSIKRQSDGRYWDGAAFTNTNYVALPMTDAFQAPDDNDHTRGLYTYDIAGPASVGDVYEWASVWTDGGYDYVESGEVRFTSLSVASVAAIAADAKKARQMSGWNKRRQTIDTGVHEVLDDDGVTVLRTITPAEAAGVTSWTGS